MAEERADLSNGGIALVILGSDFDMPTDYAYHPQLVPLPASQISPHDHDDLSRRIPSQTRIVYIGGELPRDAFGALRTVLTKRNLTFVQRRNQPALNDELVKILGTRQPPKPPEPLKTSVGDIAKTNGDGREQAKGAVTEFVRAEADLSKGSAEEARRLMRLAVARGITTTIGSLAQAISNLKRKGGRTETPRSIMSDQQRALMTLDEAIAGLQLIRDYVAKTEELNLALNKKLDAFRALMKDVG